MAMSDMAARLSFYSVDMRYLFVLLLTVAAVFCCTGKGIGDRYASRMTRDGTIFFLSPQRLKATTGVERFEYDMTCLTWSDTVTVNFSIRSKDMELPEHVGLMSGGNRFNAVETVKLYTDIVKGGYEIRMSSRFLWCDIEKVFTAPQPPVFIFDQSGIERSASYTAGQWKGERRTLSEILKLYNYSRK